MMDKQTIAVILALTGTLVFCNNSIAAKGGIQGRPGDSGETAVNRLSYPAILIPGISITPYFMVAEGLLGESYSYGCDTPQVINIDGTDFSYPNTTCASLNPEGQATEWLTAEECTDTGAPCEGKTVDRIYWQKQADNSWSAQATGLANDLPLTIHYVDWGDSIEVVTWNENSVLRVETQIFGEPLLDGRADIPATQLGFQMWHAAGQGITEQWGVRTSEVDGLQGPPYVYQTPSAIVNAGTAQLYLSKLYRENDIDMGGCPAAGGDTPPAYPASYPFTRVWLDNGWDNSCNLPVVPFTLETNVSGKYVHGYNWRMRELTNPLPLAYCGDTSWQKSGWWRLTFVPNGLAEKVIFAESTAITPPILPQAEPADVTLLEEEDDTEGTLYSPVVNTTDNLTYIDICIKSKEKGGGSSGGNHVNNRR